MTYASGGLIEAVDYGLTATTGLIGSVNAIWGAGTGDSGYGQTDTLSPVAAGNTVTALQWSTLIDRINSMRLHQSGVSSGLTSPTAGATIAFLSTLNTQISTITTNKLLSNNTVGAQANATPMTNATGWVTSSVKEVSYTWTSAAAMRYFFNCGGYVSFTGSNSALSGNTKSLDWDGVLGDGISTGAGIVRIRSQSSEKINGGATALPSTFNNNLGFHDLTTTYQIILRQYSTNAVGGYNTNYATFEARLNAAVGTATILYLRMTLTDAAGDTFNDTVTGTVQLDYSHNPPVTTYLANVWGAATATAILNTQS